MKERVESPRGYIFDYGGTLDTGGCHWGKRIWHAYGHCRVPVGEPLFREAYVFAERKLGREPIIQPGYTFEQTLKVKLKLELDYIAERDKTIAPDQYIAPLTSHLYALTQAETAASREVLLRLKEKRPLVLVSNFYGNLRTVLREFGLDGLFSAVIESAEVGVRKPDPKIFTLGVEALGAEAARVAVVGDSYTNDIAPAKQAGCLTIWLRGEAWQAQEPADTSAADRVIGSIKELLE